MENTIAIESDSGIWRIFLHFLICIFLFKQRVIVIISSPTLNYLDLQFEGLFRVTGSHIQITNLRTEVENGIYINS